MTEHEHQPPKSRTIGVIAVDEDTLITIDHVYDPGDAPCEHCGKDCLDPGMVGLTITEGQSEAAALLSVGEALAIANRLTKAASLILESCEAPADLAREAAKLRADAEGP